MREAGFGFEIQKYEIIQISSQFAHSEIVLPALALLSDPRFRSADDEFRKAHQEFRAESYEDCLTDCGKALESVLKVISADKGWGTSDNATAKVLLDAAYANELIPSYTQAEFSGLRSVLDGGVPTVRNKAGGHGKGTSNRIVSRHLAAFQLHQTAAAIIFLVESANN